MENERLQLLEQRIFKLLEANGYPEVDALMMDKEDLDKWLELSDKEILEKYIEKENLDVIIKYHKMLSTIYQENLKGNLTVNMTTLATFLKLDYYHATTPLYFYNQIKREGTSLRWIPGTPPRFSHAREVYQLLLKMKAYNLDSYQKKYIKDHVQDKFEAIHQAVNPKNDPLTYFQCKKEHLYQKTMQNRQQKQVAQIIQTNNALRKNPPMVKSPRDTHPVPSANVMNFTSPPSQVVKQKKVKHPKTTEKSPTLLGLSLQRRLEQYEKMIKIQRKSIKALERELLQLDRQ